MSNLRKEVLPQCDRGRAGTQHVASVTLALILNQKPVGMHTLLCPEREYLGQLLAVLATMLCTLQSRVANKIHSSASVTYMKSTVLSVGTS